MIPPRLYPPLVKTPRGSPSVPVRPRVVKSGLPYPSFLPVYFSDEESFHSVTLFVSYRLGVHPAVDVRLLGHRPAAEYAHVMDRTQFLDLGVLSQVVSDRRRGDNPRGLGWGPVNPCLHEPVLCSLSSRSVPLSSYNSISLSHFFCPSLI